MPSPQMTEGIAQVEPACPQRYWHSDECIGRTAIFAARLPASAWVPVRNSTSALKMTEPGRMLVKVMLASVPDGMEFLRAVLKASCCSGPKLATDMSASVAVKATWGNVVACIAVGPGAVPGHIDKQVS